MTTCNPQSLYFPSCLRHRTEVNFGGGDVTSDGGVLLLREIDRLLGFTKQLARVIPDPRNQDLITHPHLALLKQRIYGLALGYEDLNDHDTLRVDPALQTAIERDECLASSSHTMPT